MAETNSLRFLLNQGSDAEAAAVVKAPAFSLTKVMIAGAVIVTPVATFLAEKLNRGGLEGIHLVVLGVGLLAFLAIIVAADVLARGVAVAAAKNAEAAATSIRQSNALKTPLPDTAQR